MTAQNVTNAKDISVQTYILAKTTLFKSSCTDSNNRILFIKAEYINEPDNDNIKEDDSTE